MGVLFWCGSVVEVEKVAHDNANEAVGVARTFDVGGYVDIDCADRDGADAKALACGFQQEFNLPFQNSYITGFVSVPSAS